MAGEGDWLVLCEVRCRRRSPSSSSRRRFWSVGWTRTLKGYAGTLPNLRFKLRDVPSLLVFWN